MQIEQEAQLLQRWRRSTAITPFKIIQGRRFWYQWKAHNATSY